MCLAAEVSRALVGKVFFTRMDLRGELVGIPKFSAQMSGSGIEEIFRVSM